MNGFEARILYIERALAKLARDLVDLVARVVALEQKPWADSSGGGSGGGSNAFYVCVAPSSGSYAGTWTAGVPTAGAAFNVTVYQVSGAAITSLGTQTVYNWLPSALANSKVCALVKDDNGNYAVVSQSCA